MTAGPKPAPPTSAPWTEAHRREARALLFRLAADQAQAGNDPHRASEVAGSGMEGEAVFRRWVSYAPGFGQNEAIDRAVTKVRALAEGRLVRETGERFFVRRPNGEPSGVRVDTWDEATTWARDRNEAMGEQARARGSYRAVRVRVARTRRAP